MAFSLYAATVPSSQQILSAVMGMLDKAEAFCVDQEIAPNMRGGSGNLDSGMSGLPA